ncbi:MAG: NAD(P)/FAD-dependent oxidoreductase [Actinomycetota bacterium]|nr:NAD(P)/FAD-dependent oxidoreductase [Actinomycetota bacterium]
MSDLPSVLVLGGGFAGTEVARRLGRRAQVTIVSVDNFLLFTPMLAEVAAADIDPRHISAPIRQLCPHARLVLGEVASFDGRDRSATVRLPFEGHRTYQADAVVVALGSVQATFGVPGVEEYALGFKGIGEALRIRNRLLSLLETASETGDEALTGVVVVGAGFSGAELAAALSDFLGEAARRFYRTAPPPRVTLVDAVDRVAPMLPLRLSKAAERALANRGVRLVLGRRAAGVAPQGLEVEGGEPVRAATVIWAAGVQAHPLARSARLPVLPDGRLRVDRQLAAAPGVFALGDVAAVPDGRGGFFPPTAQHALRQGRYLGHHLPEILAGRPVPPFRYRTRGQLVSLGHRNAVGMVMGVNVSGFLAWWLWRSYYLFRLPTGLRKARVALDWAMDLVFAPDIAGLPSSDLGPLPPPPG